MEESASGGKDRLIALVAELGNVSEACRRLKVDRSVYYRMRRRAEKVGAPASSSFARSPERIARLLTLCLEHPEWGCDRLAYYLTLTGDPLSSPTAQKILIRHGLGRMEERFAAAKKKALPVEGPE